MKKVKNILDVLNKDNLKYDFLTIRLKEKPSFLEGLVSNSNVCYLTSMFKVVLDIDTTKYNTYSILDNKNNLLCQIMIVKKDNNRFDFYDKLTIYGTFFNLYYDYLYELLFIFGFDDKSIVMRVDLKIDSNQFGVMDYVFNKNIRSSDIGINGVSNNYNYIVRRAAQGKRYKFRIYNKLLDIMDKRLYLMKNNDDEAIYKQLLDNAKECETPLTRFELQLNSKYIKEERFTLNDILDIDKMFIVFSNIFNANLENGGKLKRSTFKKEVNINAKRRSDIIKHTNSMAKSYLSKIVFLYHNNEIDNFIECLDDDILSIFSNSIERVRSKRQNNRQNNR